VIFWRAVFRPAAYTGDAGLEAAAADAASADDAPAA
jgi:hypothetical protein